jgi:hypothetical protein
LTIGFRDRGIYRLPNGRELVAVLYPGRTPVLYNLWARIPQDSAGSRTEHLARGALANGVLPFDQIHYELNDAGRLLFQGQLSAWSMEDLSDTGRTASNDFAPIGRVTSQDADDVTNERAF